MQTPLQITFRHLLPSPSLEARVRESVKRLKRFNERITSCRIVIGAPAGHRSKGAPFTIKVDLTVPGRNFCVDTERVENPAHLDVYVALHDAFETLRRQLQDYEQQHLDARRQSS